MTDTQESPLELINAAVDAFGARVHGVPADGWNADTPDSEWTVRDLVSHVTAEHLWVPHLLRGETIAQVGDRYSGDVLGDDPVAAWDAASAGSRAAWTDARDDQVVHLSFGDVPVREYADQMLLDTVVHGWDLARGAGLDDRLDPTAVRHVLAYAEKVADDWRAGGAFAEAVKVDSDDPQDLLLGLVGRQP